MSSSKGKIAARKLRALARAERRLKQRFEDIEWEEEVLKPALDNLKHLDNVGKLPELTFGGTDIIDRLKAEAEDSESNPSS